MGKEYVCYIIKDDHLSRPSSFYPNIDAKCVEKNGKLLGENSEDSYLPQEPASGMVVAVRHKGPFISFDPENKGVFKVEIENDRVFKSINDFEAYARTIGGSECLGPDAESGWSNFYSLTENQWQECGGVIHSENNDL